MRVKTKAIPPRGNGFRFYSRIAAFIAVLTAFPRASGAQTARPVFVFGKPDLELLAEGDSLERQFEHRALLDRDPALEKHLTTVSSGLLPEDPIERVQWRFRILRDPVVNAFSIPDGAIFLTTGLLAVIENDDQLAAVLAHEAAHVVNRDACLAFRRYRARQAKIYTTRLGVSAVPLYGGLASLLINGTSETIATAFVSGYGMENEQRADRYSAEVLARSGRDTAQIPRGIDRMRTRLDAQLQPAFYTDYAAADSRLAYLLRLTGPPSGSAGPQTEWVRLEAAAIRENVRLDLDTRRFHSALAGAKRLVAANPDNAADLCLLAGTYAALGPRTEEPEAGLQAKDSLRAEDRKMVRQTEEEEYRALASTSVGGETLKGNLRKAEAAFQRALALDPDRAKTYLARGNFYRTQGRDDAAAEDYRRYLTLEPSAEDRVRVQRWIADRGQAR